MKTFDTQAGAVFLIVALLACFESYRLELGTPSAPLPGFFPFLISVILAVLSAFCIANSYRREKKEKAGKERTSRNGGGLKISLFIFVLLVYTFFLEKIGFLVSTALLLFFMLRQGGTRWVPSLVLSLAVALLSYFIFNKLLGTNLPAGLFTF